MFEPFLELASIHGSICRCVYPLSFHHVIGQIANIGRSVTMPEASLSMFVAMLKVANVRGPIRFCFVTATVWFVVDPFTRVNSAIRTVIFPLTPGLTLFELTRVNTSVREYQPPRWLRLAFHPEAFIEASIGRHSKAITVEPHKVINFDEAEMCHLALVPDLPAQFDLLPVIEW